MYTFEQLFEAANPNRNPRLKLDIGDTVVVLDTIKTVGYEPQKNKNMVGKQGKVIARYPYPQSLKIGVDFGDGKEFKFNSHYLERVIQPGETAPVSRDTKKQEIINQLVAKNPQVFQLYDEQKHQQILEDTIKFIKSVEKSVPSNMSPSIDFTTYTPLYVVNFPSNIIFPIILTSKTDTKLLIAALSILGLTPVPQAISLKDNIMVQTGPQGCSFVVISTSRWSVVAPLNISEYPNTITITDPINESTTYLSTNLPIYSLLANTLVTEMNTKSSFSKYLCITSVYPAHFEYGDSIATFKKLMSVYDTFVKTIVAKQPILNGKLNGVKAFGPDLIVNFADGKLHSTEQEPSLILKKPHDEFPIEVLLWIDGSQFSDRQPNAIFKKKDREFYVYMQPQHSNESLLFTQQTKQQMVDKYGHLFSTSVPNTQIAYDLEMMTSIDDSTTINYVCFGRLDLESLKGFAKYSSFDKAIFLSDASITKMTQSNISNDAMENLTNIISRYLQLKDRFGWPDCDMVCLCDSFKGNYYTSNERYLAFPSNLLTIIQQYKQFKAQTRQDIGDELADIGDMF